MQHVGDSLQHAKPVNEFITLSSNLAALLNCLLRNMLLLLISAYQHWISPLLGQRCRFIPSCSVYAVEAINRHGVWRGSYLTISRLSRCHPLTPCGYDPVP